MNPDLLRKGMMWAYRVVITQTLVVPESIGLKISPGVGNRFAILSLGIGKDDYAAGRTLNIDVRDASDGLVSRHCNITTLDNGYLQLPQKFVVDSNTVLAANAIGTPQNYILVSGTDYLLVTIVALAQNETLTLNIRALISNQKPTITNLGADQTNDVSYNKVI